MFQYIFFIYSLSDSFYYWQIAHYKEVVLLYFHVVLQCIQLQFNSQFEAALKSALVDVNINAPSMSSKELCQELAAHFKTYDQGRFWSKVHQIIPEKTPTQLKEYFQKSFQQCLHQQISAVDEAVLRNLERRMKDHKPAEVADVFMEMTNQKYFKRSAVVFIVNSRL
ncbi:SANT/Myb_domain [Hexamita inflata]|uniref:SANT/Myb domain n=1 Tax=Hexamita inflata TaxID=28002 RepID=A0AA86P570_9EUKA|nr:SANT/Myb domain [Hexamita inflata]CAI9930891.1 SANT/Myb domain [Hexamita inflata]CAI9940855.1 SANT/Myb domain [Hexamita inflata]